jgi:hypothetical protein
MSGRQGHGVNGRWIKMAAFLIIPLVVTGKEVGNG